MNYLLHAPFLRSSSWPSSMSTFRKLMHVTVFNHHLALFFFVNSNIKSVTAYILHLPQATIGQLIMGGGRERSNKEFTLILKR